MFHYWFPKGAGWFGLGCFLIGGILDHQKNKEADRKLAEMRRQGRGYIMTKDKNGNWRKIY